MKNVIFNDNDIIGTYENVWKFFKEEIKRQMDDNGISFQKLNSNFKDILNIMEEIENDGDIYSNTLIVIKESPMGNLYYKVLKESD